MSMESPHLDRLANHVCECVCVCPGWGGLHSEDLYHETLQLLETCGSNSFVLQPECMGRKSPDWTAACQEALGSGYCDNPDMNCVCVCVCVSSAG